MRPALVIFSKPPLPGQTKSRLQAKLSAADASLFHRACLMDLCAMAGDLPFKTWLFAIGGSESEFTRSFPGQIPSGFAELGTLRFDSVAFRRQRGQDLGERLDHAAALVLRSHPQVMLIGSDLPDLSTDLLLTAAHSLSDHDVVIGPAMDGGYYLIGLTRACPELFREIAWGTGRVLAQTLQAARDQRLRVCLLPPARDIDTWEDIVDFVRGARQNPGSRPGMAYRLAEYLIEKYGA